MTLTFPYAKTQCEIRVFLAASPLSFFLSQLGCCSNAEPHKNVRSRGEEALTAVAFGPLLFFLDSTVIRPQCQRLLNAVWHLAHGQPLTQPVRLRPGPKFVSPTAQLSVKSRSVIRSRPLAPGLQWRF